MPKAAHRQAKRRLKQLGRTINPHVGWSDSDFSDSDDSLEVNVKSVRIGDVTVTIVPPQNPELVPEYGGPFYTDSQEMLRHLRWMLQKDKLHQDMFLIGPPGPLRRQLVMLYAAMTQREVEYVALSKDITDADLKQRRELHGGTSFYVDQAAVRAAIHGRILILDGIEKAERNVLPILNNLLENREMSLEDGRFLTTKDIDKANTTHARFEKVHERFLVIALGLPVPPYIGYPLDPPLRSRFQSRDVKSPDFQSQVNQILTLTSNKVPRQLLERLVSVSMVLGVQPDEQLVRQVEVPEFPMTVERLASLLVLTPKAHPRFLVDLLYPYPLLPTCDREQMSVIESAYRRFGIKSAIVEADSEARQTFSGYALAEIVPKHDSAHEDTCKAVATFVHPSDSTLKLPLHCGSAKFSSAEFFVETPYHKEILSTMVLVHASGKDMCLIGTHKGVGKSALVRHFARHLGYTIDYIPLFRDMSSRDLLQRRSTSPTGDTIWENSLLVEAAIHGQLAILDGVEALSFGTLNTLQRLVSEREMQLPDGTRLISTQRYKDLVAQWDLSKEELTKKRLVPIHPSFRIIALARAGTSGQMDKKSGAWLTAEILSMFHFIVLDTLPSLEEQEVLACLSPGVDETKLKKLLSFARRLRRDKDETIRTLSSALSTRQLIRICRRLAYFDDDSLYTAVNKAALSRFMPTIATQALHQLLVSHDIYPPKAIDDSAQIDIETFVSDGNEKCVRIGNVVERVYQGGNPLLIPSITFYENPAHNGILREMLKDYQLGDHLLLIGNQGVGKNKLADYFLQILGLPREYIQLHRDSTVQSLTTTPAIRDGVLIFEDSALVKAVREGTILVVDEADKAPTYVTAVLKSLLEDGQMVLGDGRRIVSKVSDAPENGRYLLVHRNFRMIVLANRPGYPFLGNDFYREIGDVFSCHAVDNPDMDSEMYLLKKYGPNVPEDLLKKLSSAFTDLRKLTDEGLLTYPYSTRELVNIVIHLQTFPTEGISKTLQNVFDFDQYDQPSKNLLIEVFEKHGIPVGLGAEFSMQLGTIVDVGQPVLTELWTRIKQGMPLNAKVETCDLAIRGEWDIAVGEKWKELERHEGRSIVFSEQLYSMQVPTQGEALDVAALADGTLFVITTNPVTLHWIEPTHHKVNSLDLYEYFPLQRAPPRLRISIIHVDNTLQYIALHNPSNNELLCCDFAKKRVTSIVTRGFEPVKSIMCSNLSNQGILVFYQQDQSTIAVFDFKHHSQHTIVLPMRINQLFVIDHQFWIVRGSRDATTYALYAQQESDVPTVLEAIQVLGENGHPVGTIESVCEQEFAPGHRFALYQDLEKLGTIIKGCSYEEFIQGKGSIQVLSFLDPAHHKEDRQPNLKGAAVHLKASGHLATIHPTMNGRSESLLDLLDPDTHQIWRIVLPLSTLDGLDLYSQFQVERQVASLCELDDGRLITMDMAGTVRLWQVVSSELHQAAQTWRQMIGVDQRTLSIIYETDRLDADGPAENTSQVGKSENPSCNGGDGQGSGGSAGTGDGEGGTGDGEGASGGGFNGAGGRVTEEGRQEVKFEDINTLKLKSAGDAPDSVTEAQKAMHEQSMEKMLSKIEMTQADFQMFQRYMENVRREVHELRVILEGVEAKNQERVWLKNQASGDLDDTKIVEGLTGERAIYKKRGEDDPEVGLFQDKPKRMNFVFDLSASMFRFNPHDRRLERSMEVALMLMEAFRGFEHKFAYRIAGHSGDSANIEFVSPSNYPKTEKDEFEVISKMRAHSQYCLSGDNTLGAASLAIQDIVKEDADDYFVVILSDANIAQYNIHPNDIAKALKADDRVTAQMVFIGSIQDQAEQLKKALGNHAHICVENKQLPKIMKSLFLASMV